MTGRLFSTQYRPIFCNQGFKLLMYLFLLCFAFFPFEIYLTSAWRYGRNPDVWRALLYKPTLKWALNISRFPTLRLCWQSTGRTPCPALPAVPYSAQQLLPATFVVLVRVTPASQGNMWSRKALWDAGLKFVLNAEQCSFNKVPFCHFHSTKWGVTPHCIQN